jgi:hypothetical protein
MARRPRRTRRTGFVAAKIRQNTARRNPASSGFSFAGPLSPAQEAAYREKINTAGKGSALYKNFKEELVEDNLMGETFSRQEWAEQWSSYKRWLTRPWGRPIIVPKILGGYGHLDVLPFRRIEGPVPGTFLVTHPVDGMAWAPKRRDGTMSPYPEYTTEVSIKPDNTVWFDGSLVGADGREPITSQDFASWPEALAYVDKKLRDQ